MKSIITMLVVSLLVMAIAITGCMKKETKSTEGAYYTCPMHSDIHEHRPGKCPVCGMDLVEKKDAH